MTVWKYTAAKGDASTVSRGVISAPTAVAARQLLRQAGLRPVRVEEARATARDQLGSLHGVITGHLRKRRTSTKAEFFDSLATLIRSGVTPAEALLVLAGSRSRVAGIGVLARALADDVAQGVAFSDAATVHSSWFDAAECAVLAAGERSGDLEHAMMRLADRQSRSHDLNSKLTGALAYPLIVTFAGIGVAVFLAVRTLPQLTQVLIDSDVQVPALTRLVMGSGQAIATHALWTLPLLLVAALVAITLFSSRRLRLPPWFVRRSPRVLRRARTAESFLALAELTESGLTLVEAVRIIAPTASGPLGVALAGTWRTVADRVEQGETFDSTLDDAIWFTEEHRRLIAAGSHSGELSSTLRRIGERDRRGAERLIDRAATLLEPLAIVLLTIFVGTVVLAAVLPIVRLQEIIG